MLRPLLSALVRATPVRWYLPNKISRMQLIQHAIDVLSARTYLEIGVDQGQTFSVVKVPVQIGVDPIAPAPDVVETLKRPGASYFATTSDDFFAQHAPTALASGCDVVFVDGLHTYGQTYRDIQNSLKYLNPGGVILVHDCLPASAEEARVAETYDEAWRLNGPDWSGLWTGDGWKSIVAVRSGHTPGQACVLNCDHGVAVVHKSSEPPPLSMTLPEIDRLDYATLAADPAKIIGLSLPAKFNAILNQQRKLRRPN